MKSILVLTKFEVKRDPRPVRVARCLRNIYRVTLVGTGDFSGEAIEFVPLDKGRSMSYLKKVLNLINKILGRYDKVVQSLEIDSLKQLLAQRYFDVIFCHDLVLLPQILHSSKSAKVIFDAREYYPAQYEDRFTWRLLEKRFKQYLCDSYMKQCEKIITVSENIAERYASLLDMKVDVQQSWPEYHDISPSSIEEKKIKIIHHGGANENRRIENMIKMMDFVDHRFTLDLMLMYEDSAYYERLLTEAAKRDNVSIIDTVSFEDIIPFTNSYDIGLFLCPPTTYNLKYALPNKLFEFIQARLLVAIGPSVEMEKVVKKYDLGIVAKDFSSKAMARELCNLSREKIEYYKSRANIAAKELNAETNCLKIRNMIDELLVA